MRFKIELIFEGNDRMFFFLLFILLAIAATGRVFAQGAFNKEYLSKDNTKGIKGLFVILVLLSHYAQYVTLDSVWDAPYLSLREHLNQMVVVPFLFYSGYGIMKSIQNKGNSYVKSIMKKRVPKVWFEFIAAILCFLIVNLFLGKTFPLKQILLSFVGWSSVGNSNWYIMGMLILYILTYLTFSIFRKNDFQTEVLGCLLLTLLSIVVIYILMIAGRPNYCYNTLIIYSVGCWYALFQERIESWVMKNDFSYLLSLTFFVCLYCLAYLKRWDYGIEGYTVWGGTFTVLLLLLSMKFCFRSNILDWFGEHVFSIYILQRIPMIVLQYVGVAESHKYMFLIMSLLITMILAILFEKIVTGIEKKIL